MKGDGDLYIAKPVLTQILGSFEMFELPKCVHEQRLKIKAKNCLPHGFNR